MSFQHEYPYGDVHELNLDWIMQTMQEFINSEREAGHTPTVSSVRSFFTHKYPYGDIHELNLDWVIQTALRMEEIGDSVDGDIGELQTRMTAAEGNISTLDNTVSGLSDSVEVIESDIEDLNDDVAALNTTVGQHTTQIAALDAKIDAQVVANPTDAATGTLSKIEIAGTVYTVEGSGGSEVEANPTGEPTDTLQKIGIDGTIYEVGASQPVSKTVTGNPINITDAADAPIVSGTVTFEPKQDLHGYDKPWAGGAGKNKLPLGLADIKSNNTVGTWSGNVYSRNNGTFEILVDAGNNVTGIKINGTFNAETVFYLATNNIPNVMPEGDYIVNGCPSGGSNSTYRLRIGGIGSDTGDGMAFTLTESRNANPEIVIANAYNAQNLVFRPMIRLATETDPTFEPYTNICPITGYDDCEIEVTGKNLFPDTMTWELGAYGNVGNKVSAEDRVRTLSGIEVRPNTQYTISFDSQHNLIRICQYDSDGVFLDITYSTTFITVTNCRYITITANTTNTNVVCQLELGSTATAYEPYQSTTYTIDLDGTRYGGRVDLVSGEMRVHRASVTFDGTESWTLQANSKRVYTNAIQSAIAKPSTSGTVANVISNMYSAVSSTATYNGTLGISVGTTGLFEVSDGTGAMSVDAWKAFLSDNNLQVCYELATPFTVQLTPEQIRTLEGTNNISTNMTSMSLEYITQDYQPLVELIERSAGHHYSTQERVVGTWFGKPLYEKSWDVSIALPSGSANTWVSTGIAIAIVNCDGIAGGELIDDQNQCIAGSIGFIEQKTYFAIYPQIGGRTISKVTIRYTKTTD